MGKPGMLSGFGASAPEPFRNSCRLGASAAWSERSVTPPPNRYRICRRMHRRSLSSCAASSGLPQAWSAASASASSWLRPVLCVSTSRRRTWRSSTSTSRLPISGGVVRGAPRATMSRSSSTWHSSRVHQPLSSSVGPPGSLASSARTAPRAPSITAWARCSGAASAGSSPSSASTLTSPRPATPRSSLLVRVATTCAWPFVPLLPAPSPARQNASLSSAPLPSSPSSLDSRRAPAAATSSRQPVRATGSGFLHRTATGDEEGLAVGTTTSRSGALTEYTASSTHTAAPSASTQCTTAETGKSASAKYFR
mmetsp:Transcript_58905/g.158575  ORF Transcript_58905/g.158575 Transcript_58905/m.158575 type:complete len:310 (-) Transcript_58905:175-1104(-)